MTIPLDHVNVMPLSTTERTPVGADDRSQLMREIPAFAGLSGRQLADVADVLDVVEVPAGRTLMRQGERGHEFHLVVTGTARVERDGVVLATLTRGDVVGEQALVGAGHRNATVIAETDMVLATGTRPSLAGLVAAIPAFARQVRDASSSRAAA